MTRRHRLGSGRRFEELLDGSRPDDSALSGLLDAARAPGSRDEMTGLPAARSAFMSVPYVRGRPAASVSRLPAATRTAAGRLLALKFVAALSGATLVGGAAYAATGARLLGGSTPHKHPTYRSAPVPTTHGRGGGGHQTAPGAARPTPSGQQPQAAPATTTGLAGSPASPGIGHGKSSVAHSEHPPSNSATPPGQSNTPGPRDTHTPKPHHTPSPHDTKPQHTPNPHKSSPGHGQARTVESSPSATTES
jgi:hypothetical protein